MTSIDHPSIGHDCIHAVLAQFSQVKLNLLMQIAISLLSNYHVLPTFALLLSEFPRKTSDTRDSQTRFSLIILPINRILQINDVSLLYLRHVGHKIRREESRHLELWSDSICSSCGRKSSLISISYACVSSLLYVSRNV